MAYLDYPGLQRYHGKVQGEIDELKDDLDASIVSENVVVIADNLRKYYFNPTAGTTSDNVKRLTYYGGFALRGAKAIDVDISDGYKWNIYFASTMGQYSLVEQYSDVWLDTSEKFIIVPSESDRLFIACIKSDGTDFSDEEIASVFQVKLRGVEEPEIYSYDYNTDFNTKYYGTYQYNNKQTQYLQYARLTQDRFYKIDDLKIIRFQPDTGYKAVINFFNSSFVCLGNNGGWITESTLIRIPQLYETAKYFKITIVRTDNATMTASDFNKFSISYYSMTSLAPTLGKLNLEFLASYGSNSGDVAVYGDTIVLGDTNKLIINDTVVTTADNDFDIGHGNNIMFGKTLYNSFPKLYAGGWYTWNKCIFINAITENSASLLETITFDELPDGYVNACIDEPNERVYIFEETGSDTYQGNILFAVGDFEGNILSSKMLNVSIPIIQGMDFVDGFCYVTSGDGTSQYPNYLMVFDIEGNLLSKSLVDMGDEIEGISIDKNVIYIKGLQTLFKMPI